MNILLLIQLFLAHILTDFVFQPNEWVNQKREKLHKTPYFWLHIGLAAALSYLFTSLTSNWYNWQIPFIIFITHGIIDYTKLILEKKTSLNKNKLFIYDQIAHIAIILGIWLYDTYNFKGIWLSLYPLNNLNLWVIITAVITLTTPSGIVIGKIIEPFRKKIRPTDSLKYAGTYIGVSERLLIFIFIMIGQYSAIGFLLASKSILRISKDSDKNARKKTEYVLVGTLISFLTAILIALLTKYLIIP